MKLKLKLRSASLTKTRNPKDVISADPKQYFLLHATNNPTNAYGQQLKSSKLQK